MTNSTNWINLVQLNVTLLLFVSIRICLFFMVRYKRYQLFKHYNIPGPKADLIGGHFRLYRRDEALYKTDVELTKRFGRTYGIYIGDEPIIVTTDLEMLKEIFIERKHVFKDRATLFLKTPISDSVLFAPYARYKIMRKAMSPYFSSYHMRGAEKLQFVEDSIKLMLDYLDTRLELSDSGRYLLDIQDLMKSTALHMISSMAINLPDVQVREKEKNVRSLDAFLSIADKGAVEYAVRFPFLKPLLNFVATHFEYDKTIALIHRGLERKLESELQRLSSSQRPSSSLSRASQTRLINLLIKLQHEGKLTRQEVISNADAILFAGYDTTSTTLTYVFWALAKHQTMQTKLRQDLRTYGIESTYLDQVLNETMRLYPTQIGFTSRIASETVQVGHLVVPQGTKVIYNSWLLHRDPHYWPNPLKFDPERFRPGADFHPCAFAPFGLGERKCLGYLLAKLEMKMIVCDLLLRYQLELVQPLDELEIVSYANVLTKPRVKVLIELCRIQTDQG